MTGRSNTGQVIDELTRCMTAIASCMDTCYLLPEGYRKQSRDRLAKALGIVRSVRKDLSETEESDTPRALYDA